MVPNISDWKWTYLCPTGLTPWLPREQYLAPCFQELCLQVPVLALFAIVSAYNFGHQNVMMHRNRTQIGLINLRIFAVCLLGLLPIYDLFSMIDTSVQIWPVDVLVNGVAIISWMVHLGRKCLL